MKIVAYDDAGRPAMGNQLDEGVLPTGHADLRALIQAGPRELGLPVRTARTPASSCSRPGAGPRCHGPNGQRDTGELLNLLADWEPDEEDHPPILVESPSRCFYPTDAASHGAEPRALTGFKRRCQCPAIADAPGPVRRHTTTARRDPRR